jgi:hypothetical protein
VVVHIGCSGAHQLFLCDIIHTRDARGRIENQHRDREREEQEQCEERDYDYYGPYYDEPHWE